MNTLADHQEIAVKKLDHGKILCGGTGVGKSRTAIAYYIRNEDDRDIFIITTAKKRDSLDWEREAAAFGIGKRRDGSIAGVLTVDSWNNLDKYNTVENAFFIFDEQRVVGSGAWTKSFIKIAKKNNWILLSATPGDTWMDYIPVFVANGFYKNRSEFLREHVIFSTYSKFPKVDRYVGVNKLVRLKNSLLVEMPYQRTTVRKLENVSVEYDKDLFDKVVKKRWHVYKNRPLRDVAELFSVMRKVVNSDSSRIQAIQMLMKEHPKLIVFYNFDYELEALRTLKDTAFIKAANATSQDATGNSIPVDSKDHTQDPTQNGTQPTIAEWNGHKHEPIPKTDKWVYLVQYVAGSEGWNCVETDAMIFYSLTYSYKNFAQAQGRIDRMDTKFTLLHYYILKSVSPIDVAVWKNLRMKKSFNERKSGITVQIP